MAPETRLRKFPDTLSAVLVSACLEWLLIAFLFIHAALSYAITKFAHCCKLQVPCVFCSRIDHVLGKEKLGYCWDLICSDHKLEISSLVLCRAHSNLVNVHELCENCLFSFATVNKSNSETYRLLVGKLAEQSDHEMDQDPLLGHEPGNPTTRKCACCHEAWVEKHYGRTVTLAKSMSSKTDELDVVLSAAAESGFPGHGREEKPLASSRNIHFELDPLSRMGYTEVRITSDTESEVCMSDDNLGALVHETNNIIEDLTCVKKDRSLVVSANDEASEEIIASESALESPLVCSDINLNHTANHASTSKSAVTTEPNDHSLGKLHWQHASDGISSHDLTKGLEELNWQQAENSVNLPAEREEDSPHGLSSSGEKNAPAGVLEESDSIIDSTKAEELETNSEQNTLKGSEEFNKGVFKQSAVSETDSEINTTASDVGHQASNTLDLGDAYKLAMGNRGRQLSGKLAEQWLAKDSSRVSEDLKQILSQLSASRGIEPVSDTNPRLSVNSDEMKTSDASNFAGMQMLQRRASLERDDSGLSLDGSLSEIEGESDINRCKRQIQHYKKLLSALYKELEEERSASAVAVSEAMAMITKLQEEKATLNMEALQYLRLMDEQSQYDIEALQKANDLLAEKEKELQDLEAALELYRNKFPNGSTNQVEKIYELKVADIDLDNQDSACIRKDETGHEKTVIGNAPISSKAEDSYISFQDKDMVSGNTQNPLLNFEDERLYILQCLKKLEKHWHLIQNNERNSAICCGHNENKRTDQISELKEECKGDFQEISAKAENSLQSSLVGNEATSGDNDFSDQEVQLDGRGCSCSLLHRGNKLASIENVVSDLNLRLQALELDKELLEHTINLLRNGGEGLKFIQDIANNLQELQGIGKMRMDICDYWSA